MIELKGLFTVFFHQYMFFLIHLVAESDHFNSFGLNNFSIYSDILCFHLLFRFFEHLVYFLHVAILVLNGPILAYCLFGNNHYVGNCIMNLCGAKDSEQENSGFLIFCLLGNCIIVVYPAFIKYWVDTDSDNP